MPITKTILKNTNRQAAVKFVGTGNVTLTTQELATANQTVDAPNVQLNITDMYYSAASGGNVVRDGNIVLSIISGQVDVSFTDHGYSINESANANIDVRFGTGTTTMILCFSKTAGYIEPDRQSLQPKDR